MAIVLRAMLGLVRKKLLFVMLPVQQYQAHSSCFSHAAAATHSGEMMEMSRVLDH